MSDYSFLKTGFNIVNDNNESDKLKEEREQILGLQSIVFSFMENAIKTSEEYVKHSGRNSITKEDIKICLKAETFDYLERSDVVENVKKWRRIIDDSESDTESDIDDELEPEAEELDVFKRSTCICNTCDKLNNIDDKWEQWIPLEGLETILHNAIIKHF